MATGTTLIAKVRDELQDTTDASFSTSELLRYLNRGATEFCATTGCLQDTATINTNGATFSFTLSSSCTNLVAVFNVQYAGIFLAPTYIHEITYKFGASVGTPTAWYQFAAVLYIDLKATTATGSSALTVFYLRTPVDMSAVGSAFDFPNEWESGIISYALARCYKSQRDTILAEQEMVKYETMRATALAINKFKLMGNAT